MDHFSFYLNIFDFRNMTTFSKIRRYLATTVSKPCFTFTSFIWLFGAFILLNYPRVSTFRLWLHQFWSWRLLVFYTGCLLFGPRLMSDSLSCDPMSRSDWDVTYIFIVIRHVSCRCACYHITILFQGWCNSLIVLVIQLVWQVTKASDNPFSDLEWMLAASVCLGILTHI